MATSKLNIFLISFAFQIGKISSRVFINNNAATITISV